MDDIELLLPELPEPVFPPKVTPTPPPIDRAEAIAATRTSMELDLAVAFAAAHGLRGLPEAEKIAAQHRASSALLLAQTGTSADQLIASRTKWASDFTALVAQELQTVAEALEALHGLTHVNQGILDAFNALQSAEATIRSHRGAFQAKLTEIWQLTATATPATDPSNIDLTEKQAQENGSRPAAAVTDAVLAAD